MTPEEKLVLIASKITLSQEDKLVIDRILKNKLDWGYITNIIARQRIYLAFFNNLNKKIPEKLLWLLAYRIERDKESSIIQEKELLRISKIFKDNKINFKILKGLFLAKELYTKNYLRRLSGDIDVLVEKEYIPKAKALLIKRGYQFVNHYDQLPHFFKPPHEKPAVKRTRQGNLIIELHHHLLGYSYEFDIKKLFKRKNYFYYS